MAKRLTLETHTKRLREINEALKPHLDSLPPDVQDLLRQKSETSQAAIHEVETLLSDSSALLENYEALFMAVAGWKAEFLDPLYLQWEGKNVNDPVTGSDLRKLIEEIDTLLKVQD